jgi:prevent-host-death family protein
MNAPPRFPVSSLTMTSREFNQHTGRAKAAADLGPVIITDRGKPAYVLLSNDEYERLKGKQKPKLSLLDALEQKGGPEYDFEIDLPKRKVEPVGFDFGSDD